jgi:hypothetical protein
MKQRMMSEKAMSHLFDHILDGFRSSHHGILNLKDQGIVRSDEEIAELLKKNSDRLIDRIKEFKITQRLLAIFFAFMFGYFQISGEDLEMRRARRVRTRRRNETEQTLPEMT